MKNFGISNLSLNQLANKWKELMKGLSKASVETSKAALRAPSSSLLQQNKDSKAAKGIVKTTGKENEANVLSASKGGNKTATPTKLTGQGKEKPKSSKPGAAKADAEDVKRKEKRREIEECGLLKAFERVLHELHNSKVSERPAIFEFAARSVLKFERAKSISFFHKFASKETLQTLADSKRPSKTPKNKNVRLPPIENPPESVLNPGSKKQTLRKKV